MNTVCAEAYGDYKVSASRFVSVILPVLSKEDIDNRRNEFKKEHLSATHICYAYRLANPDVSFCTDSGEPKGTAGKPLLQLLMKHQLTNTAVFVARYFGGKKLGVAGLKAAYFKAAEASLMKAVTVKFVLMKQVDILVPFSRLNEVYNLAKKYKASVNLIGNGDPARLSLILEAIRFESFEDELRSKHLLHSS
jgi:uncharacterized YigZ family protein